MKTDRMLIPIVGNVQLVRTNTTLFNALFGKRIVSRAKQLRRLKESIEAPDSTLEPLEILCRSAQILGSLLMCTMNNRSNNNELPDDKVREILESEPVLTLLDVNELLVESDYPVPAFLCQLSEDINLAGRTISSLVVDDRDRLITDGLALRLGVSVFFNKIKLLPCEHLMPAIDCALCLRY